MYDMVQRSRVRLPPSNAVIRTDLLYLVTTLLESITALLTSTILYLDYTYLSSEICRLPPPSMSNSSIDNTEEKRPATAESNQGVPKCGVGDMSETHQLPTPPRSNNALCDYSDIAAVNSQNHISPRRRHRCGGRKRKSCRKLQLVSELDLPRDRGISTDTESKERGSHQDNYDAEELQKARRPGSTGSNRQRSHLRKPKVDKGIRAFNMAIAESSGSGRPMSINMERPNSTGRATGREKRKGGGKSEEDEEGKGNRNPVSIRLDLNLEIEVFLRTKIKGSVTITFL
jgi:hypothetical protein